MNDLYGNIDEEKRKLTKKPSSEKNLGDWFKRKGAPGKKGGWVDCNTCRDGKCKPCGRSDGESRSKKPRCRPTPGACKGFKNEKLYMDLEQIIHEELEAVLDEKKKKKQQKGKKRAAKTKKRDKKKKSSGKKDACYSKVKSRYKVWPSAYASGALVKCRKVGAANWGNSKKESLKIMIEDELTQVLFEKEEKSDLKAKVIKALRDEGGAAGMDALKTHTKASKEEINKIIDSSNNIKVHEDGDIILMDSLEEKKKKKACKPSKGKRFAKRVNGKCRSFGQKGQAKGGGDRIRPGTKKGDAYCARSAKIKKCKNPPCANALSRKKWKCRGSKSMKEQDETIN